MLPSVLVSQLQQGVEDFLQTKFPTTTPHFHGMIDRFFGQEGAVFKGPYVSLDLPFRHSEHGADYFPEVPLEFPPYAHQAKAFDRLSGDDLRSTLVATGTGSGKTEAFLWPVLDYARQHKGEDGIKAVLIYPMNALANDQAGRIAKAVDGTDALGDVRVGLYVGDKEKSPTLTMGEDHVITDRETLRRNPPDILLTNYKMLDYLLTRPGDAKLWRYNGPETLRYLVVDELHTFDGAQGTDLACLLRRLKDRLGAPDGHVCCIGTSATLGGTEDFGRLRFYAEEVFDEPFGEKSVVGESRIDAETFLEPVEHTRAPEAGQEHALRLRSYDTPEDYIRGQVRLWFDDPPSKIGSDEGKIWLGEALRSHEMLHVLLDVLEGAPLPESEVREALAGKTEAFGSASEAFGDAALQSFLSLLAWARSTVESQGGTVPAPFVHMRNQLWLRELRRMVASIEAEPDLAFWDDLPEESSRSPHLPLAQCLECGSMGWVGIHRQNETRLRSDLKEIYQRFFNGAPTFSFAFPAPPEQEIAMDGSRHVLCGHDLHFSDPEAEACEACGRSDRLVQVYRPFNRRTTQDNRQVGTRDCPFCGERSGLSIIGAQAASLASVLISQLYASTYNDDKKLLTFSDAVQDAAHRAGFFEARTFRFNLRGALQKFVEAEEASLSLENLQDAVAAHYEGEMTKEDFASTFIAPDMEWLQEYETLRDTGQIDEGSELPGLVRRRLQWEAWSEYGFRARLGRSLEKTGSSVAKLSDEHVTEAASGLLPMLQNEVGNLREVTEEEVRRFIRGLGQHLKNQGAVANSELTTYIEQGGNYYPLNQRPHLPRFGYRSRLPAFVSERSTQRFDPVLGRAGGTGKSWLEDWALRCFGHRDPMLPGALDQLYNETLPALVRAGILEEWQTQQGNRVWGLRPAALIVDTEVAQLTCDDCGHNVSVAREVETDWEETPCLRYQCGGAYEAPSGQTQEYYRQLYSQGDLRRIVAREHTGLLGRDQREAIERSFKGGDRPWEPNLLSCTPTLELGVDVGQLSSVILCSVPPSTASFVQRIGRGGRRSGNAIDVTVANGRPHDLYFFEDPTEMIAGDVEPPGVFLGAVEVLVRQFVAYTFDRWIASGIPEEAVPSTLSRVLRGLGDDGIFPHTWLSFIGTHYDKLFEGFKGLFGEVLGEERADALQRALEKNDGIENRVLERLAEIKKRRKDLRRRSRRLYREISKMEEGPMTEAKKKEVDEMRREKTALQNIYQEIGETNTYNFFTDAGLLPNYAFPESGVTLRSILYRKPAEGGQQVWDEEFVRPAPQALRELAPGSTFYADGRQVVVDQIDLSGEDAKEQWRLCDRCAYMERAETEETTHACPRCGSPNWSDQGQERLLVSQTEVRATTWDRKSRIDDSSEGREREFYEMAFLASFDRDSVETAYRIDSDDTPFGFEYIQVATFREINFGRPAGQPIMEVGGQEIKGEGFRTCPSCGRVAIEGEEIDHTRSCSTRQENGSERLPETLFLYREITSEAVRILLPESTMSVTPEKVESFKAALELGLKEAYEGSVDHLKTAIQEGPGHQTTARRRYLLLYDSVPGGTGYLADMLRDKDVLMEILQQALDVLSSCPCIEEDGRDGCYRCLYAYRNHYDMPHTSRSGAQELLEDILSHRDQLLEIETVDKISIHGTLESELEARFLQRLRGLDIEGSFLEKGTVRGQHGYKLKMGDCRYDIEPQVTVGPENGVPRRASIDFVIHPVDSEMKPIAVFLDGLQYHRTRIGTDLIQRRALRASGNYHVWSLTWGDVTQGRSPARNYIHTIGRVGEKLLTQMGETQFQEIETLTSAGSFSWLLRLLKTQDAGTYRRLAFVQALLLARKQSDPDAWAASAQEHLPGPLAEALVEKASETPLLGLDEAPTGLQTDPVTLWAITTPSAVQSLQDGMGTATPNTMFAMHLDDRKEQQGGEFGASWNGFLRLYNLLQFLPESYPVSTDEEAFNGYEDLLGARATPDLSDHLPGNISSGAFSEDKWADAREFALEGLTPLLNQLYEKKVPAPSVPHELVEDGKIVAEAELGWAEAEVAVLASHQEKHQGMFEDEGWTVFQAQDVRDAPDKLLSALQNSR